MLPTIPIRLPSVLSGQPLPSDEMMTMIDRVVADHFSEEGNFHGEESELSTNCYPICACRGGVPAHVDVMGGHERGKLIYGLVLRSEGHVLRTDAMVYEGLPGILLKPGDLYELHPLDRHWTRTDQPDGELVFAAAFIEQVDPRFGKHEKMAHDLLWETMASVTDWCEERDRRAAVLAEQERFRHRIA